MMLFHRRLKIRVHMVMALAFVPVGDVQETFQMLWEDLPDDVPLEELMEYMLHTYIGREPRRGGNGGQGRGWGRGRGRGRGGGHGAGHEAGHIIPMYPLTLWNHYEATLQGEAKTNNCSEGWHNRFRLLVNKNHPDLYSALQEIQKEQNETEISVLEYYAGRSVRTAPSRKWKEYQDKIINIVSDYDQRKEDDEVLDYLRCLAYNIVLS